jgi:hypothetical protein
MNYGFGEASFEYFESCNFSPENTNIDVSVFMFDLRMIKGGRDLCVFFTPERYWESWETKPLMKMGDFDVCNKKIKKMNITIKGKM